MEELIKYKKKIFINLVFLLFIGFASVVLLIGAAQSLKGNTYVYVLILLFLINVPIFISTGLIGIKVINSYLNSEQKRLAFQDTELEEMEKEVEEKVKEADDLSFNLNLLKDDMIKYENWESFGESLLSGIGKQLEIVVGLVYKLEEDKFETIANYGYFGDSKPLGFKSGEGLSGQTVKDKKSIFLSEIPEGYIHVISGLGQHQPRFLSIFPLIKSDKVVGVLELATFIDVGKGIKRRANEISEYVGNLSPELTTNE